MFTSVPYWENVHKTLIFNPVQQPKYCQSDTDFADKDTAILKAVTNN